MNAFLDDLLVRRRRVQQALSDAGADGAMLTSDVSLFYLTGRVFNGWLYLPTEGAPISFVRRPVDCDVPDAIRVHRADDMLPRLEEAGWKPGLHLLLEGDELSYNDYMRLFNLLQPGKAGNASAMMRRVRMIKTPWEVEQMRQSAKQHEAVYAEIPECFRPGMTDLELQAEIERRMRLHGSIGVFRTYGPHMNIFMGSLLAGDNAQAASPFDFALGGAGQSPVCPIGANGTELTDGTSIMVDMAGNFTEYISDMTRVFSIGRLSEKAYSAHRTALDIKAAAEVAMRPGLACSELYSLAIGMVEKAGLTDYFMGTRQQAKFVGHGIGLEINEPPVLTPRSKNALQPGMIIAFEPKFVIPGVGAVGVENSYLITETGMEKLTHFEEQIISLT
ncbi:peptidase M24 [Tannerella sp. oral taxon 808]|nr:peptidase M24 [Tannerella sp. oral taxon 808]